MNFTPEDLEAVRACLEGIDRYPVTVEPAAAKLLIAGPAFPLDYAVEILGGGAEGPGSPTSHSAPSRCLARLSNPRGSRPPIEQRIQ
jgi:hypothetical protein